MSVETIKVLVVEPMKPCEVREVPHDLKSLQGIVGGSIEMVSPFNEAVAIVCNAEGKVLGLPFNRPLCDNHGIPYDIVCGTFFIAGVGAEDFISLTDEQAHCYKELYDNIMVLTAEGPAPQEKPAQPKKKRGKTHER